MAAKEILGLVLSGVYL